MRQLPALHGVAIRLRDEGSDDHLIAVALGLDDDQVPVLMRIATSKLAHLMALSAGTASPESSSSQVLDQRSSTSGNQ